VPKIKRVVQTKSGPKVVVKHLPYPSAKAGNYRAPVDTAGMDPEMKRTLGIGRGKKRGG